MTQPPPTLDVLVWGSDPATVGSLQAMLREGGLRPRAFAHLSDLVRPCLREGCRLAVVSLDYPDILDVEARYEPVRLIREICPEVRIIVVSDPEDLQAERRLRTLGIFYLLTTPVSSAELRAAADCALRGGKTPVPSREAKIST